MLGHQDGRRHSPLRLRVASARAPGDDAGMRALLLLLLTVPGSAVAADRTVGIGSFDRLRVDGPFEVRVAAGASPSARISGARDAIEAVDVRLDGRTLVVRPGAGVWGERPRAADAGPPVVTLGTPAIASIASVAGARVTATGAKGDRIDLSVTGPGAIAVANAAAADVNVTVIGAGTVTVAGRTTRALLVANGPATIDAAGLEAGEIVVRLDGPGTIGARARYTAQVSNTGLGTVTVAGDAKCTVRAVAGGRVDCGAAR